MNSAVSLSSSVDESNTATIVAFSVLSDVAIIAIEFPSLSAAPATIELTAK